MSELGWKENEQSVRQLQFLVKTYEGLTKLSVATKNRLCHLHDIPPKFDSVMMMLDKMFNAVRGDIRGLLNPIPIWNKWLVNVPGIGESYASQLLILYYWRFIPICEECGADLASGNGNGDDDKESRAFVCPECGTKAKGQGVLKTRFEEKDFPNISGWWHYLGMHVVDGKKPKRTKNVRCDWSPKGRTLSFLIGKQFERTSPNVGHPYRKYYDERKAYRLKTHPDTSQAHRANMAMNETAKLFLSHFWQVARSLDGKPLTQPWVIAQGGHSKVIPPFYWDGNGGK